MYLPLHIYKNFSSQQISEVIETLPTLDNGPFKTD